MFICLKIRQEMEQASYNLYNPPYQQEFNIEKKIAEKYDQTISGKQSFDVLYPDHKTYYNDKRVIIFDKNFKEVENYFLNDFKNTIDMAIDYSKNKNLQRAEDFKSASIDLKGLDFGNPPYIKAELPSPSQIKYGETFKKDPNMHVSYTDPYHQIYPA
jgi:hypothetical protein